MDGMFVFSRRLVVWHMVVGLVFLFTKAEVALKSSVSWLCVGIRVTDSTAVWVSVERAVAAYSGHSEGRAAVIVSI